MRRLKKGFSVLQLLEAKSALRRESILAKSIQDILAEVQSNNKSLE